MSTNKQYNKGFTIVELLVVIVIIGILAAITVVSYTGITNKAVLVSLQSDLTNASQQLKIFQVYNAVYPTTISTDCATYPDTTTNKCLKPSYGNVLSGYSANNSANPQTFSLTASNNGLSYVITNDTKPTAIAVAPLSPVADWLATAQGDHYGNFYDQVSHSWATVTRTTTKTIYDPATQKIYDVPANKLAINPRSDGKSGSEVVIEEGRTNYLLTSYFNADGNSDGRADNWSYYQNELPNLPTYSLVSSSLYGQAQRMQYTAGACTGASGHILMTNNPTAAGTFSPGNSATFSFWVKGSVSNASIYLQIDADDASNNYITSTHGSPISLTGSWQLVTYTYANLPANTSRVTSSIDLNSVDTGDTADISVAAVQLEKGPFATSYIPTTTAAVARNADVVTVPTTGWSASTGTAFVVAGTSPSWDDTTGTSGGYWAWDGDDWNQRIDASTNWTASYIETKYGASDAYDSTGSAAGYHARAGRWSLGEILRSYVDGINQNWDSNIYSSIPSGLRATAFLGYNGYESGGVFYNNEYYNGPIQRLVVYNSALSSANVSSVSNAITNGP